MESFDEKISEKLVRFAEMFAEDRGITGDMDPFDLKILPVAEYGNFYIIFYGEALVGSLLHYKNEMVISGYINREDMPEKKRFN